MKDFIMIARKKDMPAYKEKIKMRGMYLFIIQIGVAKEKGVIKEDFLQNEKLLNMKIRLKKKIINH